MLRNEAPDAVVIFDDLQNKLFAMEAAEAARGVQLDPHIFDHPEIASRHLDGAVAVISTPGFNDTRPWITEQPATPLLRSASALRIPVAILGNYRDEVIVDKAANNIFIPTSKFARIQPILHEWLMYIEVERYAP